MSHPRSRPALQRGAARTMKAVLATSLVAGTALVAAPVANASTEPYDAGQRKVRGLEAGQYEVDGLAERKRQLVDAGATTQDLAVGMLESNDLRRTPDAGDAKGGDSTEIGVFNQNWGMLRASNPDLAKLGKQGTIDLFDRDLSADVDAMHRSREKYGSTWADQHRAGAAGAENPDSKAVKDYRAALWYTEKKLYGDRSLRSDDTRVYVDVPWLGNDDV